MPDDAVPDVELEVDAGDSGEDQLGQSIQPYQDRHFDIDMFLRRERGLADAAEAVCLADMAQSLKMQRRKERLDYNRVHGGGGSVSGEGEGEMPEDEDPTNIHIGDVIQTTQDLDSARRALAAVHPQPQPEAESPVVQTVVSPDPDPKPKPKPRPEPEPVPVVSQPPQPPQPPRRIWPIVASLLGGGALAGIPLALVLMNRPDFVDTDTDTKNTVRPWRELEEKDGVWSSQSGANTQ